MSTPQRPAKPREADRVEPSHDWSAQIRRLNGESGLD